MRKVGVLVVEVVEHLSYQVVKGMGFSYQHIPLVEEEEDDEGGEAEEVGKTGR